MIMCYFNVCDFLVVTVVVQNENRVHGFVFLLRLFVFVSMHKLIMSVDSKHELGFESLF